MICIFFIENIFDTFLKIIYDCVEFSRTENIKQNSRRKLIRFHDDVIKWKLFPNHWSFVRGIHRSPVNSPHRRPVMLVVDTSFGVSQNKRMNIQSNHRRFETPWRSCDVAVIFGGTCRANSLRRHEWRTCASVNWVINGSGNSLSPIRRQAITWTNADLQSITPPLH